MKGDLSSLMQLLNLKAHVLEKQTVFLQVNLQPSS